MSTSKKRLLFVCLGNICRSPAAEGVMREVLKQNGLAGDVEVASAGMIGMHAGELPDARMRAAASRRGYALVSRARKFTPEDFERFDLILTMDEDNRSAVLSLAGSVEDEAKVKPFCAYCRKHNDAYVPDPYYGGPEGFDHVLDLLEDGCAVLAESLRPQ